MTLRAAGVAVVIRSGGGVRGGIPRSLFDPPLLLGSVWRVSAVLKFLPHRPGYQHQGRFSPPRNYDRLVGCFGVRPYVP